MPNELDPIVGQWYLHRDKGEMFRVVAVDADAGSIETQFFDGDVEELDSSAWRDMDIEAAEQPEDWSGPFDITEPDDVGAADAAMSPRDWREPLESIQPPEEPWQDARAPDEREEDEAGRPIEPYTEEQFRPPDRTP